jgi:glycosyltransferase involved in cell wall biosynthesis
MGMLAHHLQSHGHEVDWFSSTFHHYLKHQRADHDAVVPVADGYRIQLLHTPGYPSGVSLARLRYQKILGRRFSEKALTLPLPDVIIATLAPLPLSKAAVDFGNRHNIPVLVDIRDLWPDLYREQLPRRLQPFFAPVLQSIRRSVGKTLARADGLWGVTEDFLKYGLQLAGRGRMSLDRVLATAYPVWSRPQALESFARHWERYGLSPDDFLVIFLGTFSRQFVLEPVLEAARLLSDHPRIRFVLCGSGGELGAVREKTNDLPRVVLPGWVGEEAIHSLLSAAGAGLAPYTDSINFTLNTPNKFGEYLSGGVPVLVSIPGTMERLLKEYDAGSRYQSSEELAAQIRQMADDPHRRQRQQQGALALYEEHFRADRIMAAMDAALQDAVAMKKQKLV